VNLVLGEEPRFTGTPASASPQERSLFTLVPSLEFAERCYDVAKFGEIPEELWVDCVIASNVDDSLAPPGKHVMTCFVQYVPYKLREGNWDEKRQLLGERVIKKISEYAPNVPNAILARQVITPLDLERIYGLTEGNIFHGDLKPAAVIFYAPCSRLVAAPHADSRPVLVRSRSASRRRSNRRAGTECSPASAARLEAWCLETELTVENVR
jgi:phytoene dehydrogenase-like protein